MSEGRSGKLQAARIPYALAFQSLERLPQACQWGRRYARDPGLSHSA